MNQINEESVQELRELNKLVYLRPDNGSLIDKRTSKSYNFTNTLNQPSSTAQMIINSGGDAIWGPTSYLKMKYVLEATTNAAGVPFGTGNVLNLIKSVRLTHRSGEVLEYIQDFNVLAKIKMNYMLRSSDKVLLDSLLSLAESGVGAVTHETSIPMWLLLGCFSSTDSYIPPGFLAGAKLELELEKSDLALITQGAGGGAAPAALVYKDVEMNLVLDSAQVYDDAMRQLLDEQADVEKSGLQFAYSTWFSTSNAFNGTSVNFDIQQSASVTEKVVTVVRQTDKIGVPTDDSFLYVPVFTDHQYRLGSQYLPQAPVSSLPEAYSQSLIAFEAWPHQFSGIAGDRGCDVAFSDFANPAVGKAVFAATLEKSSAGLVYSGEPTNNSRILNFAASKAAVGHTVNIFLCYLRVANIMGDNIVVDR